MAPPSIKSHEILGNVAVMVPRIALNLLLLSPVMHWAVLIDTNARYGCEEGIQTLGNEVFAYCKLCDPPTYASRELEEALRGVKCIHIHLRVFLEPIPKVSLKRSQKVDLGTGRSQGPICSPSLEAKDLRRALIGV